LDWQEAPENATDFLIDQPAGRYLYVRIRLRGSETKTPVIHRVRIDFPRVTSLNQLPTVYRENDEAEDFTERFLSLFDATMQDVDRVIERLPALVDARHVPEEVLPWLGAFLGIAFHSSWSTEQRRSLLQAAPQLYRQRGTRAGLVKAIELIFGVTPAIDESVFRTASGAIGVNTRLGAVRLFGKSRSRFRVGRSALGEAPLRSYGNPDHDPVREGAHRFRVLVPPDTNLNRLGYEHLDQLIAKQKPAHTVHTLRVGGQGFILGRRSAVGIDTQLIPTAPPVLGGGKEAQIAPGNVYLSRSSILRPSPRGRSFGLRVGITSSVGVHTVLE
jgi:phage tail-like protein